ncbi:MAG: TolC family protein [Pirellulales bacterium]
MHRSSIVVLVVVAIVSSCGCTRTRYRTAADRDSYSILQEKASCLNAPMPAQFHVRPDIRSRFYDPTNPDCPSLPTPRPILYGYELPYLASDSCKTSDAMVWSENTWKAMSEPESIAQTPVPSSVAPAVDPSVVSASYKNDPVLVVAEQKPDGTSEAQNVRDTKQPTPARSNGTSVNKVAIPRQSWEVLPKTCIDRMLEFETLRSEFGQTFKETPRMEKEDRRRLTLANLMELASINSREYQARKELLYRTALALTRQRYQYELNPTPVGNGTAANFRHSRDNGVTENTLGVPSGTAVQKTLASGGQFLTRFANSVVLTFNGPSGFAADVGSEMIFDFQQTLFQRDVRFENLTQTERDVLYAMRDYIRFRKQLFRDVSGAYYSLLLNYRGIEINAQDYFTNTRGFIQSQAEYRTAEKIPRIQVDQFEQNVLRTRSNLVNNCFTLEAALDQLKFRLGLPTEMVIHLDLAELESISLKDELSVARQMINRARTELVNARNASSVDATTLSNVAEVLADRMSKILRIQQRMEASSPSNGTDGSAMNRLSHQALVEAEEELEDLQQLLAILSVTMQVEILRSDLNTQLRSETPAPPLRVIIRALEFGSAQLQVVDLAIESNHVRNQGTLKQSLEGRRRVANQKLDDLSDFLERISTNLGSDRAIEIMEEFNRIPQRRDEALELVKELEELARDACRGILPEDLRQVGARVQEVVDDTIELSDILLEKGPDGWEEIELDHNEALLTGLVQRLDLMNQRGDLADAWRQIKLAGDDLRSIVDLRATQSIRTRSTGNDPFDFSFDDSDTRLSMALDTPLNRRLQRNNFRLALISYNVGLRNLMAAEDTIKLDVREDLRQLALDRNQYTIAVASAALAYERVISTSLRLQLAVQNVAARDFLEAQQAYTNALSSIARLHVNYITDRLELFFDLEAFDVDGCLYWSGVHEDYGPQTNTDFPNTNPRPYDYLPPKVWYSPTIRQMEKIGPGDALIHSNQP